MIHNEDKARVELKITDEGDLFIFCPECKGVWQTTMNIVRRPKEGRPFTYGGTGINLDKVPPPEAKTGESFVGKEAAAKELFPEAFI